MPQPLFQNINVPQGIQAVIRQYIINNVTETIQYIDGIDHPAMTEYFDVFVPTYLDELRAAGWWIINQTGVWIIITKEDFPELESDWPYIIIIVEPITFGESEVTT